MPSYAPGRPPTDRDTLHLLNGCPVYLGTLVSAGTASPVNNLTTATPFYSAPSSAQTPGQGTLAGRMLLLQSTGAGLILPSTTNLVTITAQTGSVPGVLISSGSAQIVLMTPTHGWMQWLPTTGAANLLIWELI